MDFLKHVFLQLNLSLSSVILNPGVEAAVGGDAVLPRPLLQPRLLRGHPADHRPDPGRRRFDSLQPGLLRRQGVPDAVVAALPRDGHPRSG